MSGTNTDPRRHLGKGAKSLNRQTSEENSTQPESDESNGNNTDVATSTAACAENALTHIECRRSSRKKQAKYDVRELLGKNPRRQEHKIGSQPPIVKTDPKEAEFMVLDETPNIPNIKPRNTPQEEIILEISSSSADSMHVPQSPNYNFETVSLLQAHATSPNIFDAAVEDNIVVETKDWKIVECGIMMTSPNDQQIHASKNSTMYTLTELYVSSTEDLTANSNSSTATDNPANPTNPASDNPSYHEQPLSDSVSKPVSELLPDPVADPVDDHVADPVPEHVSEYVSEIICDAASDHISDKVIKPTKSKIKDLVSTSPVSDPGSASISDTHILSDHKPVLKDVESSSKLDEGLGDASISRPETPLIEESGLFNSELVESMAKSPQDSAFFGTPADTPINTPSSTQSHSSEEYPGLRRSNRIKQITKTPKALVGRGLVEAKLSYSLVAKNAQVNAKNAQFLKERLSNFQVIRENEYHCKRVISKEAKETICDCFLTQEQEERGELGCGEDCLNRLLMIECGPDCNMKLRCTNNRFQKYLYSPCSVFRTEKKGFGIQAEVEIQPNEFLNEYVGEVIDGNEFERRRTLYSRDKNRHYYFMALHSDAIIDSTVKGSISRFINHSCEPNAETQKWTVNGEVRIGLFSIRTILPGEEITFDYEYQRYGREAQRCFCESSKCRGWIGAAPSSDEGEQMEEDTDSDSIADEDVSESDESVADDVEVQRKLEMAAAAAKLTALTEENNTKIKDKKKREEGRTTLSTTTTPIMLPPKKQGRLFEMENKENKSQIKENVAMASNQPPSTTSEKHMRPKRGRAVGTSGKTVEEIFAEIVAEAAKKIKPKSAGNAVELTPKDNAETRTKSIVEEKEDKMLKDERNPTSTPPPPQGLKNQKETLALSRLMVRAKLPESRLNLLQSTNVDTTTVSTQEKLPTLEVAPTLKVAPTIEVASTSVLIQEKPFRAGDTTANVCLDTLIPEDTQQTPHDRKNLQENDSSDLHGLAKSKKSKQKVQKPPKPCKQPSHREDLDIEAEISRLGQGLKNQKETLTLSRLMVRAKLPESRLNLLQILRKGETPCRRLFLDYNGLQLLHGVMSDDDGNMKVRMALLETLECLPISNKTMLTESKVYQTVRNWSGLDGSAANSLSPSDDSSKESSSSNIQPTSSTPEIPAELKALALKLLTSWDALAEVFRISKRERIDQMKEHEREADRQYAEETQKSGSSDWYNRDRFGRSSRFSKPQGSKEVRSVTAPGPSSNDIRRRSGMESGSNSFTESTKHLSKEQRREMFALQVARETEQRAYMKHRKYKTQCEFFGYTPNNEMSQDMPLCLDPKTWTWFNKERKPLQAPPFEKQLRSIIFKKSTNPADYELPDVAKSLPSDWSFAITTEGNIYYYHNKHRIPQWEPPSQVQIMTNANDSPGESDLDCSTEEEDDVLLGMNDEQLSAYLDKRAQMQRQKRRSRLVGERPISPRRAEDRIYNYNEVKKYRERRQKMKKRKEVYKRKVATGAPGADVECSDDDTPGALALPSYLLSSDEDESLVRDDCVDHALGVDTALLDKFLQGDKCVDEFDALTSKRILKRPLPPHRDLSVAPSTSAEAEAYETEIKKRKQEKKERSEKSREEVEEAKNRKHKEKFRLDIACVIVENLKAYCKESCTIGRIKTHDDFCHLTRKLTQFVVVKESKYCEQIGRTLYVTESVKYKARQFIKEYLSKYGTYYERPQHDHEYKDIPGLKESTMKYFS